MTETETQPAELAPVSADPSPLVLLEGTFSEFERVSAGLLDMQRRFDGVVFDVQTTAGMNEAKKARAEVRAPRYAVQKVRDASKSHLNALKRNIEERADQIIDVIDSIESPIVQQIEAEEARRAAVKAEAERLARERGERIAAIRAAGVRAMQDVQRLTLADLQRMSDDVTAIEPSAEAFGDMATQAEAVRAFALQSIGQALVVRAGLDEAKAEQDRQRQAEREELERMRAELAQMRAQLAAANVAPAAAPAPAIEPAPAADVAPWTDAAPVLKTAADLFAEFSQAPATAAHAPAEQPRARSEPAALKLSDISARVGLMVTAADLQRHGIEPAERRGAAVLFRESDFAVFVVRLIAHLRNVAEEHGATLEA